jgi:HSP20 family protein
MSLTATTDPPFGHIAKQMGKMAEQLHRGYFSFYPNETWTPSVNLYETETAYLVCVDLAGVDKNKIELTVENGRLKLRGTRAVPSNAESPAANLRGRRVRLHLMEIDHGAFCREVELPEDVRHERINASYKDGLLWVELPKK